MRSFSEILFLSMYFATAVIAAKAIIMPAAQPAAAPAESFIAVNALFKPLNPIAALNKNDVNDDKTPTTLPAPSPTAAIYYCNPSKAWIADIVDINP
jgi:hypothetical protein